MKALKRILYFLTSRLFLTSLLILIQLIALLLPIHYIGMDSVYFHAILSACSLVFAICIANDPRHAPFHLTWAFLILLLPLIGWPLYWILRHNQNASRACRRCEAISTAMQTYPHGGVAPEMLHRCQTHPFARQMQFLAVAGQAPIYTHTAATYFPTGEDFFPAYLEKLMRARRFIFLEYFIINKGALWRQVRDILVQKRAQGVEIRILYDDIATIRTISRPFRKELEAVGIQVHPFNPYRAAVNSFMSYRDHRKITVIDGEIGFTGGINLADEYINKIERFGYWKDCAVQLQGDAVAALTHMFLKSWSFAVAEEKNPALYLVSEPCAADGLVQPYSDSPAARTRIGRGIYLNLITAARRYIWITAPYLILEQALLDALCLAADSGVDVRIITPHIPDKWYVHAVTQSNYPLLIEAGVRVYEYKPGFIHAKTIVADDCVCMVGTTNFDYCSFYSLFENGVLLYDSDTVLKVRDDLEDTFQNCIPVTPQFCKEIPLRRKLTQPFLRMCSPFL